MGILEVISLSCLVGAVVISLLSSVSDFKSMTIPNWHSGVVILLFIPAYLASPDAFFPIFHHLAALLVMFIVSYLMFHFGVMGGGDSKLATALSLWVGLKPMAVFLFFMAVTGGILGAITIYLKNKKPVSSPAEGSWVFKAQQGVSAVPYAIAINVGFLAGIFHIVYALTKS